MVSLPCRAQQCFTETHEMYDVSAKTSTVGGPNRVAERSDVCGNRGESGGSWPLTVEWLATLSHEVRSPLATVLYALEEISDSRGLDPDACRACGVAERQVRRALQIADDLFDYCAE